MKPGLLQLAKMFHNLPNKAKFCLGAATLGGFLACKIAGMRKRTAIKNARPGRLVVIIGCDSGMGLTMAKWAADLGYFVLAGVVQESGDGAQWLRNYEEGSGKIQVERIDVTDRESIQEFHLKCLITLQEKNLELYTLILNAGILIFGEYFWLTEEQKRKIFEVNFWGSLNVSSAFQRQILLNKSRIIIISSENVEYPLPLTTMYAASKGALEGWAKSLRLELDKYGVTVVLLHPGSFARQSQLCVNQSKYTEDMRKHILETSVLKEVYIPDLDIMDQFCKKVFMTPAPIVPMVNFGLQRKFCSVLEDNMRYRIVVKYENLFQKVRHFIVDHFPQPVSDEFARKLVQFPKEGPKKLRELQYIKIK